MFRFPPTKKSVISTVLFLDSCPYTHENWAKYGKIEDFFFI